MSTSPIHFVVTDSGIGGLSACAAIEHRLSRVPGVGPARITYFNVWPNEGSGYNDMADTSEQAAVFDRALAAMAALGPNLIVIACNTLSVVYEATQYRRTVDEGTVRTSERPALPAVLGIVDAGVQLFCEALTVDRTSVVALFGTKTTIESGVHRQRLIGLGIEPERVIPVGCHGLAKSIETSAGQGPTTKLIDECTARAAQMLAAGRIDGAVHLGVCCTHYTYVRDALRCALEQRCDRAVRMLDPVDRLAEQAVAFDALRPLGAAGATTDGRLRDVPVSVVSKVRMPDDVRAMVAARLRAVGPATAAALENYQHVPELF